MGEHADVPIRGADMLKVCRPLQLTVEYINVGGHCMQKYNCEGTYGNAAGLISSESAHAWGCTRIMALRWSA